MSESKARLMQGNEAIAEGAIAAGVTFFAGYPITPSTEIAEQMAKLLPKIGGTFLQMEDEIGAMGAILGASLDGTADRAVAGRCHAGTLGHARRPSDDRTLAVERARVVRYGSDVGELCRALPLARHPADR